MLKLLLTSALLFAHALNYSQQPNQNEKQQISYVVNTLGTSSGPGLLFKKGSLNKAGNQTANVHPMRWFEFALTNPQLKANMKKLRQNNLVWKNFSSDFAKSFDEQYTQGTMTDEEITAYANAIGVEPEPLLQAAHDRNWPQFMSYSIEQS